MIVVVIHTNIESNDKYPFTIKSTDIILTTAFVKNVTPYEIPNNIDNSLLPSVKYTSYVFNSGLLITSFVFVSSTTKVTKAHTLVNLLVQSGELTEEEYAEVKALRHSLREEVNELEAEL